MDTTQHDCNETAAPATPADDAPIAVSGRSIGRHAAPRDLERERDVADAARDRFAFLAETSRCLAASLDYETTLTTVAALSLPYLGAWCIVDICTPDGDLRRLAVLHPDPDKQDTARALHEGYPPRADDVLGAPRVIRSRRPELVTAVSEEAIEASAHDAEHLRLVRALGIGAYVIVPMVARDRVLGAITFVTTESGRRFGDLDTLMAQDLGSRAAMAVDNARLHAEMIASRDIAEAASRAKGEFLAVMSHELRTPLNAIAGYAELMELGIRGPVTQEQRDDLGRIQKSQRHLLGLINGVLNYSRVDAGAVQYEIREVSVAGELAACLAMVAPQFTMKGLALELEGCDQALQVRADSEKLQQVVLNLLTNALKFTEAGGRVMLGCGAGIGTVALTVTDTGHGIAADQMTRVFEPFVQVNATLTRVDGGIGLGLAISRDLARGMGGDLTVTSRIGEGSTFTLTLPRV